MGKAADVILGLKAALRKLTRPQTPEEYADHLKRQRQALARARAALKQAGIK